MYYNLNWSDSLTLNNLTNTYFYDSNMTAQALICKKLSHKQWRARAMGSVRDHCSPEYEAHLAPSDCDIVFSCYDIAGLLC